MKLTKDEARLLSVALNDFKFKCSGEYKIQGLFNSLEDLELRLENAGKDKRRLGRTSQNDWNDLLKRFNKR
jgi:hypothetical protein